MHNMMYNFPDREEDFLKPQSIQKKERRKIYRIKIGYSLEERENMS